MKSKTHFLLFFFIFIPAIGFAQENPSWYGSTVEDKISLYGNRLGQNNMYGFGVESSTLYYKSWSYHRWYLGSNADDGNSDIMELSASRLFINPNVGIGTTNPSHKLDVNGTIRAKEVIVESGWADFVFEPGYKLPDLAEVETHIQTHGRLPDVPSAEEVQGRGLSLGESQRILMRKVEEMTLYMIQLESRNRELEARIAELEPKR